MGKCVRRLPRREHLKSTHLYSHREGRLAPRAHCPKVTYYLASILKIVLEGSKAVGAHLDTALVVTLVLPLLALGLWWKVRHVKHESQ